MDSGAGSTCREGLHVEAAFLSVFLQPRATLSAMLNATSVAASWADPSIRLKHASFQDISSNPSMASTHTTSPEPSTTAVGRGLARREPCIVTARPNARTPCSDCAECPCLQAGSANGSNRGVSREIWPEGRAWLPCVSYDNSACFQLQGLRAHYDLLPAADFGPEGFLMCCI